MHFDQIGGTGKLSQPPLMYGATQYFVHAISLTQFTMKIERGYDRPCLSVF
jgi:hypothetical protein